MQDANAAVCGEVSMFDSLRQNEQPNAMRYITSLMISLVAHTAILGVLIILPLAFLNSVQADELIAILIAPPPRPVPPPAPSPPATARGGAATKLAGNFVRVDTTPHTIPIGVHPDLDEPVTISASGIADGIRDGSSGAASGKGISDLLAMNTVTLDPPKPPKQRTPVRIGGIVQESKLIHKVTPVYPPLAIKAHVSGSVILEALIDEEGNVTNLKSIKGHPLLDEAAIQAVSQWKYSPTILNGEPVQVIAVVTVVFQLR
jgi:protein TonB